MTRLLLLTHYWPPEYGPDQAILSENMAYLQRAGVDVTVVAAQPSYPTGIVPPRYRNRLLVDEQINGIRTLRTWTYSGDRTQLRKRLANEASFAASCFLALRKLRGRYDIVLTVVPTQAITVSGWLLSLVLRARYAMYVMDLMPEAAVSLGMIRDQRIIKVLRAISRFCYRRASVIIAASEAFKRGVEAYGIDPQKVVCVPNGIDTDLFRPVPADQSIRARLHLGVRFVAIYAGTHGFSHDLDSLLAIAHTLQREGDDSIALVLVGDGSDKGRVQQRARELRLTTMHFLDPVPREQLPAVLAAADVDLITFRRIDVNRGVIPIKMYDGMACGKPIVLAIEGEARTILERAQAGITTDPENPEQILAALRTLQADKALAARFGDNGRRYAVEHYSRDRCAEVLRQALEMPLPRS